MSGALPEALQRLAWVSIAAYLGAMLGIATCAGWHWELSLLNPMTEVAAILGAVITPGANIVLGVLVILSYFYMKARLPVWTCGVLAVGFGIVACWVLRAWSVGSRA